MSLYDSISTQPWLLTAGGMSRLARDAERKKTINPKVDESIICDAPREDSMMDDNGIAHIHICGVIGHRLGFIEKIMGNTDVCDVRRELDYAQEAGANGILLHIDSPGGTTIGPMELGKSIEAISCPVYSYTDHCCASAAYWIAASCRQIWSSSSAEIGSIAILLPWIDKSMAWEKMGLSFQPITNDEAIYKSAGHGPSLTPAQTEELTARMNRIYEFFSYAVTSNRPQVDSSAMQGQSFMGCDAQWYGLVDQIGSMEQAYSALCAEASVFPINMPIDQMVPINFSSKIPLMTEKDINE